jgi:hypothetical protein
VARDITSHGPESRATDHESRATDQSHEPRTTIHESRTSSHEPRTTSHESRTTSHEPRTTSHQAPRTTSHELRTRTRATESHRDTPRTIRAVISCREPRTPAPAHCRPFGRISASNPSLSPRPAGRRPPAGSSGARLGGAGWAFLGSAPAPAPTGSSGSLLAALRLGGPHGRIRK